MEQEHQEMIIQTFVASEILQKQDNAKWDKEDWAAMDHVANVNLRLTIDMIKYGIIDTVTLREHLQQYPQKISTMLADTLHKEQIQVKGSEEPVSEFKDKLTHIVAESFVGAILSKGIMHNKDIVMDADAWKILHDACEAFQHVVLGCVASRFIDLTEIPTRGMLEFMEAVMSSIHSTDDDLAEAMNEALNATKH